MILPLVKAIYHDCRWLSEWVDVCTQVGTRRNFRFNLHPLGKEFWFVPETGTCLPKATPLLILGTWYWEQNHITHVGSLPALGVAMGLKFFSSAVWGRKEPILNPHTYFSVLSLPADRTVTPSKTLGAKGWRESHCQPGSLHDYVEERRPTHPCPLLQVWFIETREWRQEILWFKCFMCASVSSSVKLQQSSYFTEFLNKWYGIMSHHSL